MKSSSINNDTFINPSFSIKNRFARIVWSFVYNLFFWTSPKTFFSWRSFLLRLFGAKIGKGVHIYPGVKIWAPWNLSIGNSCGIANDVILYSQGHIIIGNKVIISQGSHLCAGTHDYTNIGFPLITKPIVINDNVWIAAEVFIHPGITIAEGVVVGARSVVIKDLPSWSVCSGNPCVNLKKREIKIKL